MTISRYRTGVDLGGTKIEAIVLDKNGEEVLSYEKWSDADLANFSAILLPIPLLHPVIKATFPLSMI